MNLEGKKVAILCITQNGKDLGLKIKDLLEESHLYYISKNNSIEDDYVINIDEKLSEFVPKIFKKYDYIIFIMATGIVVRTIAPLIISKFSDPAILVSDEKGNNLISLLSGHMGGANEMTIYLSGLINSNPVITTATDINNKSSLDMIAKKLNAHIDNFRENVLKINSMLVKNEKIGLYIDGEYKVDDRGFTRCTKNQIDKFKELIVITNKKNLDIDSDNIVKVIPRDIVIGVGCKKNTDSAHMINALEEFMNKENIDMKSVKEIGSIDIKKNEEAIVNLSKYLNVPFKVFDAKEISKIDYLYEKSDWVKQSVGVYSVAEPVAHILSHGNLIIKKHKYNGITFSVGRIEI